MKITNTKLFVLAAVILSIQSPTWADGILGVAENYNAFIFQNMNLQNSDAEGALAVGGNATFSSYSIAQSIGNSSTNLVVGGNLNFSNGTIYGNSVVGGSAMISGASTGKVTTAGNYSGSGGSSAGIYYKGDYNGPSYLTHTQVPSVTLPVDFSAAETSLEQTSLSLSEMSDTGSYSDTSSGITFTGGVDGLNIFSISASVLDNTNGAVSIDIPSDAYAVVNVTGATSVALPNKGYNLDASDVVWNLYGVTTLSYTAVDGSILAPSANVTSNYGRLNGTLVANSLTGYGQLNDVPFDNTAVTPSFGTPTVPLPAASEGGLVLLSGIACLGWNKRRAARNEKSL